MGNDQLVLEVQKLAVIGTIIAAFVGGLTGFLGSWIATTISIRAERRKQLLNIGFETGIRQWESLYKGSLDLSQRGFSVSMHPPVSYIYFNVKAMELIADGKLSPETLSKLDSEQKEITKTIESFSKK